VEFGAAVLTILPLLVKHTGWTLDICFPSLLTSTKSDNLSHMKIVVHIQKVSMVVVALQLMCIVKTNKNALYPLIQYLDWFMTLVPAGMRVWFSFVSSLISCCLSILIHFHKIYDKLNWVMLNY
jgi:hypothetical protein